MAFKEVTALRKAGRLDEALVMARADYQYKVDPYSASALFWTLRIACENELAASNRESALQLFEEMQAVFENLDDSEDIAKRTLSRLETLITPDYKTVADAQTKAKNGETDSALASILPIDFTGFPENIKENAGWVIFFYLKAGADTINLSQIKEAARKYLSLGLEKPSRLHSMILFYAVRFASKEDPSQQARLAWFRSFFEEWGMADGMMKDDWEPNIYEGKRLPSLAEKAIRCYSEARESDASNENIDAYKSLLDTAAGKVSENENILRKLAALNHRMGNDKEAVRITKDLIKTHAGKFYFWYELAQYVGSKELDLCIACCAKALLATRDEKFLGTVHIAMGSLLVRKGMYPEALYEAERYKTTCLENGWSVKGQYSKLTSMVPAGTVPAKDNSILYRQLEAPADEFMYSDIPGRTMVLTESFFQENKLTGKKRLMFVMYGNDNKSIMVNPNAFGLDRKTKFGTCFEVKTVADGDKSKVVSVKQVPHTDVLAYKSAVVDNVNPSKKVVHVVGQGFDMIIPFDRIYRGVKTGDSVDVAFSVVRKDGVVRRRVIDVRRSANACPLLQTTSGEIELGENDRGPFGRVNGIFVISAFLDNISDGDQVEVKYILDGGKKRVLALTKVQ